MNATYEITVKFTTDRELTNEEQDSLIGNVVVQVDDPADSEGERAEFRTVITDSTLIGGKDWSSFQYKGRVWTCDTHHNQIVSLYAQKANKLAKELVTSVHPKKGNKCRECARLYADTPPINR